jgi:acetyl-CoA synthetase
MALVERLVQTYSGRECAVASLLCDRYADDPHRIALRFEDQVGRETQLSYADLRELSSRLAGALLNLGIKRGDRVATLLPRTLEMLITPVALWRIGAVHVPLFTAFGPQAVDYRLKNAGCQMIVTDSANRTKLPASLVAPNGALRVLVVEDPANPALAQGDLPFWSTLWAAPSLNSPLSVASSELMVLLYTSGTTGEPKGVGLPVKALASIEAYMRFGLDLRPEDVYWNKSDPGWAYGLYYGLIGPLLLGNSTLFYDGPFDVAATYRLLEKYAVTNFAAAPSVYRALRAAGDESDLKQRLRLRVASSAGEPISGEVVSWSTKHLGVPIYDHYGQTELGMVLLNHHWAHLEKPLRPGSTGLVMPGFRAIILDEKSKELPPGQEGQVAIDVDASPLFWFNGYYQDAERTSERFARDGRYYLTADTAKQDSAGYFFVAGRADDVIKSSGYRIGPYEVESALVQHSAVAEAVVIGKKDSSRGQLVKAFVVLKPGLTPKKGLEAELAQFVKARLSAHCYPREIEFVAELPKTPSGKVQRYLLKDR